MKTRGRELPGNYSHVLLTELFHHQSQRWERLATEHVETVVEYIDDFVEEALEYIKMEDYVRAEIQDGVKVKLQEHQTLAQAELEQLCADERAQPITYNRKCTQSVGDPDPCLVLAHYLC